MNGYHIGGEVVHSTGQKLPARQNGIVPTSAPIRRVQLPGGDIAWLVSRYDDVRAVLADPRVSSDPTRPGYPSLRPGASRPAPVPPGVFIQMDPPRHGAYRRMLTGEFTVRRMAALAPRIHHVVDHVIDALVNTSSPVDLVESFALPVPSLVICQLLGVPYADHEFFQSRTKVMATATATAQQSAAATGDIHRYLDQLIIDKERDPGDDLIGRLITRQRADGGVDHDAVVGMALSLLVAGHETTANMLSLGVLDLLTDPGPRTGVVAVADVVDHLLRKHSIIDLVQRVAVADIELDGQLIRAGEGVVISLAGANWDETAAAPGRGPRGHVAFGHGVHQCLGQHLARAELTIAYPRLLDRVPTLRRDVDITDLSFKLDAVGFGLHTLPVACRAAVSPRYGRNWRCDLRWLQAGFPSIHARGRPDSRHHDRGVARITRTGRTAGRRRRTGRFQALARGERPVWRNR